MTDISLMADIHNKAMGTTDAVSGIMRSGGERRSATEARGAQQGALSKLEKLAKVMAMQYHGDLGYMLASHTQQLMTNDQYVEIIGEYEQELIREHGIDVKNGRVRVSPKDLILDYDVIPSDGTIPGRESPDSWIELFRIVHESPILAEQFDIGLS